jgi:hypothetical protein
MLCQTIEVLPQETVSSSANSSSQSGDRENQTGDSNIIKPCSLIWWLSDLPIFSIGLGLQLFLVKGCS